MVYSNLNQNQFHLTMNHLISFSHHFLYGPEFDESRINLTVNYPKPPKSSPNISKILRKFESESKSCLHEAMAIIRSSANSAASDSAWKAYRSWVDSKISKLKDFGYKHAERKFRYRFVHLTEIWKLRKSQLCLPAPKVKEATPEVVEEEVAPESKVVQHLATAPEADVVFEPQDCVMEAVDAQVVISETHQFEASASQPIHVALMKTNEEIKADNVRVNEHLDKQNLMFQLILSRLPPPPPPAPQNP